MPPMDPPAAGRGHPGDGVPVIVTTEDAIFLDGVKVCDLPSLADQARSGTGATCKHERAEKDLFIRALSSAAPPVEQSEAPRPIRLSFDRRTPYRTMIEVIFTSGQIGFGPYELSVSAAGGLVLTGTSRFPNLQEASRHFCEIAIHQDAIVVTVSKKPAGTACRPLGHSSILRLAEHHDFAQLSRCLRQVRSSYDDLYSSAVVAPEAATPAETVLRVMSVVYCASDTCLSGRGDHSERFFENVNFKVMHL